jgi:hypothetical protein
MARTIRSRIVALLGDRWVSKGELFNLAQAQGYDGSQSRLLKVADELANQGVIEVRQRGRSQSNYYRIAPIAPLGTIRGEGMGYLCDAHP